MGTTTAGRERCAARDGLLLPDLWQQLEWDSVELAAPKYT